VGQSGCASLAANRFNVHTEYALTNQSRFLFSGGLVDSNRFDGQVYDILRESSTIANGYVNLAYERPNFFIRSSWTRWDVTRLELFNPSILNEFGAITDRNGNISQTFKHDVYTFWAQHAVNVLPANQLVYGVNYFHNAVSNINVRVGKRAERRGDGPSRVGGQLSRRASLSYLCPLCGIHSAGQQSGCLHLVESPRGVSLLERQSGSGDLRL
jgi:hypothetical protein